MHTVHWTRRRFCQAASAAAGVATTASWLACGDPETGPAHEKTESLTGLDDSHSPGLPRVNTSTVPRRVLGKTGLEVSVLAFGGGSNFMKNPDGAWEALMQKALSEGINYFDTSCDYGGSEERFAAILAPVREQVLITTKFNGYRDQVRTVDGMMQELDTSLKKLKTTYLDVFMIHAVNGKDDLAVIDKLYQGMALLKEQRVIRYSGFSSMDSADKSAEIIKALDFDVCMLAINPTTYGNYETVAVPEAIKKNMGIFAMKVMRDVVGKNGVTPLELMNWALDRTGVSSAVIAHTGMDVLEQNIALAKGFKPSLVAKSSQTRLEARLKPFAGAHALSWARPGYQDAVI